MCGLAAIKTERLSAHQGDCFYFTVRGGTGGSFRQMQTLLIHCYSRGQSSLHYPCDLPTTRGRADKHPKASFPRSSIHHHTAGPLSQHIYVFTNSKAPGASLLQGFYIGSHYIHMIDEIIDHMIEFNLQSLSPPQRPIRGWG